MSQVAKDTPAYFDSGKASPALEFKSPIKGPSLEQICIQVGTGQVSGQKGAALYDEDVKKQAQQLGLPGWDDRAAFGLQLIRDTSCRRFGSGPAAGPQERAPLWRAHLSTTEATPLAPARAGHDNGAAGAPRTLPVLVLSFPRRHLLIFFIVPTLASFYFSFTRWDLFTSHWIGLENYQTFFNEQALVIGLRNTLIYAVVTSGLKVVLGMLLAVLLTSKIIARGYLRSVIFFPVLVSTIGVGLTFTVLMNPEQGLINNALGAGRHRRARAG